MQGDKFESGIFKLLIGAVLQAMPAVCNGDKFESKTFKLLIGGSTASNACSMQLDKNIKSSMWREERYEQYISEVLH